MLLRCCLIHRSIITLRRILYLLYLYPCLDLSLFMLYLCDLLFIFIFIFIMINPISLMNTDIYLYFSKYILLFLDDNADEECE